MAKRLELELYDQLGDVWCNLEHLKERAALYGKPNEMLSEIFKVQEQINAIREKYFQEKDLL